MEEDQIENNNIEEEFNQQAQESEDNLFELINEKFREQDDKIKKCMIYIKTLNEEIKMLKSNFKILLEEKE